ncbi:DUF6941 family protein [Paucidesulfovibrio longus]|uniref:DUF6941 family protein n=1 Tax=Paucidesulfovibrio longus TaxID=889 RepID=UPI0003B6AB28|nr:hypothetical protein [Paucidesulfovibrio longus]
MLPKIVYALLCSDVIIDRESGSASFIRAFEHGTVRSLPASVPPCYIATLWETVPPLTEPFTLGLSLVGPDGEAHNLGANTVQPNGASLHKVNFRLPGLNVSQQGRHNIVLAVQMGEQREIAKELPLYVFVQPQEEGTPTA